MAGQLPQPDRPERIVVTAPAAWRRFGLPGFGEALAWTADGLVVLAAEPGADAASLTSGRPLPGHGDDPLVTRGHAGWRRLWRVGAETGTARPASPDDLASWEFAAVPAGGAVVVGSDDPAEAGWYHSRLLLLDAGGRLWLAGWQHLGNSWDLTWAELLTDAGYAVLMANPRGSAGRGLVSCWGTANSAPFYDYLLGGRPGGQRARYLDRSPVIRLGPASRPALILHGEQDRCVPAGQAGELYAGLRGFGIEAELVIYPREGHQVREPAHLEDQRGRMLRWLGAHLGAPR